MRFLQCSTYKYRVEFENLDAAGYMHHPSYLYFLERARIQSITDAGWDHNAHLRDGKFVLPVAEMHLKYLKPLTCGDIWVVSVLAAASDRSARIRQLISTTAVAPKSETDFDQLLDGSIDVAFTAEIRIVGVDMTIWRPAYFPPDLKQALSLPDNSHPRRSKEAVRLSCKQ